MKTVGMPTQFGHAGLVGQKGAAAGLERIDREHRHPPAAGEPVAAEGFDEGRFAGAGRPGNADADDFAGSRQQDGQQGFGRLAVIGSGSIRRG